MNQGLSSCRESSENCHHSKQDQACHPHSCLSTSILKKQAAGAPMPQNINDALPEHIHSGQRSNTLSCPQDWQVDVKQPSPPAMLTLFKEGRTASSPRASHPLILAVETGTLTCKCHHKNENEVLKKRSILATGKNSP